MNAVLRGQVAPERARIILFDLGNVVVDWSPIRLYRKIFSSEEEAEAFCRDVCNMAWHVEHDRGRSFADGAAALKAVYPQYADEIDAWHGRWYEMFDGYEAGVPALMARLEEAGHPLYGLSNLSAEVWPEMRERFAMIKILRDVVVSGEEGLVKPDLAVYDIALKRCGADHPGDIFFIDDSLKNIVAATDFGFRTHHFQGAAGLEAALIEEGFL